MIGVILYFITGILALCISLLFWKSKDGNLRKIMMWIFFTMGASLFLRAVHKTTFQDWGIPSAIIILPLTITLSIGAIWLCKNYCNKNGK